MNADNIIYVSAEELVKKAGELRNDKDSPMDYLRDIVGMDWGEEGLGALYYLESTVTGQRIVLKTVTKDKEQAFLPSVCAIWKTAKIKEREIFDFFGIRFIGNPFEVTHPFLSRRRRIKPEVKEHPETGF